MCTVFNPKEILNDALWKKEKNKKEKKKKAAIRATVEERNINDTHEGLRDAALQRGFSLCSTEQHEDGSKKTSPDGCSALGTW